MLRDEKNALRDQYKAKRSALSPENKADMDRKILDRVQALVSYRYVDTVLLYYPKPTEIDTLPLAKAALAAGKKVAFPVTGENGRMEFRLVENLDSDLIDGRFGIPEPAPSCPLFEKNGRSSALILVPALAFDKEGYRLGYGKGYYDRYLEDFVVTSVGLVYYDFIADRLPRGRFDRAVDLLVTEKGVKKFTRNQRFLVN